jgi:hypothetical protein
MPNVMLGQKHRERRTDAKTETQAPSRIRGRLRTKDCGNNTSALSWIAVPVGP